MKRKIEIIKNFAKEMGYEIREEKYYHYKNGRPCYHIELLGTIDNEGDPYSWAWFLDTEEEMF